MALKINREEKWDKSSGKKDTDSNKHQFPQKSNMILFPASIKQKKIPGTTLPAAAPQPVHLIEFRNGYIGADQMST